MKFSVETPDHEPIACMVDGCTDELNVLLNADGKDLAFVTVSLLDKDGNECPLADDDKRVVASNNRCGTTHSY